MSWTDDCLIWDEVQNNFDLEKVLIADNHTKICKYFLDVLVCVFLWYEFKFNNNFFVCVLRVPDVYSRCLGM